jgi:hypothetical protein
VETLRRVVAVGATLSLFACVEVTLVDPGSGGGEPSTSTGGTGGSGGEAGGGGAGGSGGACGCEALDVILAIDNTDSLDDHVQALVQVFLQIGNQIDSVASRACSFHFGVVTSTPQGNNPEPCRGLGAFSRVNAGGEACPLENGRFATEADDLLAAIPCLAQTGTGDDGDERLMAALSAALTDPTLIGPGGCNEGFLRVEAPLLILVLSDVDDLVSSGTPSSWFAELVQLSDGDASRLGAMAIIPPAIGPPCAGHLAPRLHEFLALHDPDRRMSADLCNLTATEVQAAVEAIADAVCPLP